MRTKRGYTSFEDLTKIYSKIAPNCGNKAKVFVPAHKRTIEQSKYEYHRNYIEKDTFKEYWSKSSPITFEQIYDDQILDARCNNWYCARCRPSLQRKLHLQIIQNLLIYENIKPMIYHWTWTFPGNELRKKVSYQKSYEITQLEWNKVLTRLNYEYCRYQKGLFVRKYKDLPLLARWIDPPFNTELEAYNPGIGDNDFAIISLPRSQNHPYNEDNQPGYCHLHNIANIMINPLWLEDLKKRLKYKMGFQYQKENKTVHEYLANDFFDDEEFTIPIGKRHINHTKNIIMDINDYEPEKQCKAYPINQGKYEPNNNMISKAYDDLFENRIYKLYQVFGVNKVCNDFLINPPFINLMQEFYDNIIGGE